MAEIVFIRCFWHPFTCLYFFFLSGLFLFRKNETFGNFVRKKAKTLLLPCLFFGIILSTYSTIIDWIRQDTTIPYGLRYVGLFINMRQVPFPGSLWFFPCLFLIELFMFCLYTISRKEVLMIWGACCLAVIGVLTHFSYGKGLPWSIDIALYCTIFTAVGYCVRNYVWNNRSICSYILMAILFMTSVYLNSEYIGGSVDLYSCRIGLYPLFYISAFSGIYICLGLAILFSRSKFLTYLGQNTIIIYALHFLISRPLELLMSMIIPYDFLRNLLETSIVILILVPIINIINKHFKFLVGKF